MAHDDTPSKVASHVLISMVGMDDPYLKQQARLYEIEGELAVVTGLPGKDIAHAFGTTNWLQFYFSPEYDRAAVERGLKTFQETHPKFKIEFNEEPFLFQ